MADHFVDVNKMIKMPKNAQKEIVDTQLSRYACYLIVDKKNRRDS
jgi:DNA-damage-inducible protein D